MTTTEPARAALAEVAAGPVLAGVATTEPARAALAGVAAGPVLAGVATTGVVRDALVAGVALLAGTALASRGEEDVGVDGADRLSPRAAVVVDRVLVRAAVRAVATGVLGAAPEVTGVGDAAGPPTGMAPRSTSGR